MSNFGAWTCYMTQATRVRLETLAIARRPLHENALPFADACFRAQCAADESYVPIVIGWQLNDATGNKEPGWGPLASLDYLNIEPVALLYPLERSLTCKPKRK